MPLKLEKEGYKTERCECGCGNTITVYFDREEKLIKKVVSGEILGNRVICRECKSKFSYEP